MVRWANYLHLHRRLTDTAVDLHRSQQCRCLHAQLCFDSGEQGLFSSTDSKSLALGKFTVDSSGYINMPFAGRQKVAGSSPAAVQNQIVGSLKGSAVNPQAVVNIAEQTGNLVTVDGTVRAPGRFPLTDGKTRLLDVIALAGGAQSKPGETLVTVQRGSNKSSAGLDQIETSRSENIAILPDDRIYLSADAASEGPSFTAYGAFKSSGEFKFTPGQLTLSKAMARAGGLLDDKADPLNVYLFRTQRVVQALPEGEDYKEKVGTTAVMATVPSPIVVHVNMKDPSSFLYMQTFQMQDDDILYATNATAVDLAKYLTVLQKSPPLPTAPSPAASGGSS